MILVTGGTGLVGSHLIYQLTLENNVIRATHRADSDIERVKLLFKFYSKNFNQLFKKIEWIEADLNNLSQLQDALKIYHLFITVLHILVLTLQSMKPLEG